MWTPNAIQIPVVVVQSELEGLVSSGTTLAVAAFLKHRMMDPTMIEERYQLDKAVADVAWKFIETGEIVTSDGEIVGDASLSTVDGSVSASVTASPTDLDLESSFREKFPNYPFPTKEQWGSLELASKGEDQWIEDIWISLEDSLLRGKEIQTITGLTLNILNKRSREEAKNTADSVRKRGRSGPSLVKDVMRKAEAEIARMPKPTADEKHLERLARLKERIGG